MAIAFRQEMKLEAAAVPAARSVVRDHLIGAGWTGDILRSAELLTTELVTNSVRHDGPGPIVLYVGLGPTSLRIGVHDSDPTPPRLRHVGGAEEGGRGLHLVGALSARWGWMPEGTGKQVWFELDEVSAPDEDEHGDLVGSTSV